MRFWGRFRSLRPKRPEDAGLVLLRSLLHMAWSGIRFTDTESWSLDQREDPEARNREAEP